MRARHALTLVTAAGLLIAAPAAGARPRSSVEFRFADPAITESSGLVASGGLFVTVNDSGDAGRVFTVDPADGRTVGVTTWTVDGAGPVDVEAIAPVAGRGGRGAVWVGDTGDNTASRDSVVVVRVPVGRGDRAVTPTPYTLVYPDGARDVETLLAAPDGRLLVVTKGLLGGEVLVGPEVLDPDRPNRMRRVGVALGIATDGAFFPDGRHLVVRSYSSAVVYRYPDLAAVGSFDLPDQPQGEGIAVDQDGAVFVSSEGVHTRVLRVRLPAAIAESVAPVVPVVPTPSAAPDPRPDVVVGPARPTPGPDDAPLWPWALGGFVGVGAVAVLLPWLRRSLSRG